MQEADEQTEQLERLQGKAEPWIKRIKEARKAYEGWQKNADSIEKHYADAVKLGQENSKAGMAVFWSNVEVMGPTVYSRPPMPVVAARHKERNPVVRLAGDIVERALITDAEIDAMHDTMLCVRDDMVLSARGVPWVKLGLRDNEPAVMVEHIDRCDFVHEPARKWADVTWVARRVWMNRQKFEARFGERGNVVFDKREHGTNEEQQGDKQAEVWELWDKTAKEVVWLNEQERDALDLQPPPVNLERFFPCPQPAFGTVQPRTLIPVPDFLQYRSQLEDINALTQRISALQNAIRVRFFYPGGNGDLAGAIEKAVRSMDDRAMGTELSVPPQTRLGDAIMFFPLSDIAAALQGAVELRRQYIEDVYQITGLSDIMRGASDPDETARAQTLKAQFGSVRVKQKQASMTRVARDVFRIKGEIMAENLPPEQLLKLAQINPGEHPPEVLEAALELLRNERLRPFVLEIETDSTIEPDQDANRARRVEAVQVLGPFMREARELISTAPETARLVGETLKFLASAFDLTREMDDAIDEVVDLAAQAQPQQQDDGDQQAAQAQAQAQQAQAQAKMMTAQAAVQKSQADAQVKVQELELKREEVALEAEKTRAEIDKVFAEIQKIAAEIRRINTPEVPDASTS